ncbi:hypothetical protein [Sandaracinus amylolyticus]|uniref:hypothetical protein n=1 Tax=Sandaracinus amylolyticus TaxID=927083 RepID=UPI001F1834CC|nr:hypothetical protein [Sandaracinus amylolyticus]
MERDVETTTTFERGLLLSVARPEEIRSPHRSRAQRASGRRPVRSATRHEASPSPRRFGARARCQLHGIEAWAYLRDVRESLVGSVL